MNLPTKEKEFSRLRCLAKENDLIWDMSLFSLDMDDLSTQYEKYMFEAFHEKSENLHEGKTDRGLSCIYTKTVAKNRFIATVYLSDGSSILRFSYGDSTENRPLFISFLNSVEMK